MGFISSLMALIGAGGNRTADTSDQRAEVARLNAEVATETKRALDMIEAAIPRLTQRCAEVCGDDPQMCESMVKVLDEQKEAALKVLRMAEDYETKIMIADSFINWNRVLQQVREWRETASRMVPWVEEIIGRYDRAFDKAGARN